jgi:hypothetical protein
MYDRRIRGIDRGSEWELTGNPTRLKTIKEGVVMKKMVALTGLIVLLISGCTYQFEVLTSAAPTSETPTPTKLAQLSTPTLTLTVESRSSTPPIATEPQFFGAQFTLDPGTSIYQTIFPAKTQRVYAVWEYRNMRAGMKVRRDWYYNDTLWISREEPWDFARYGAEGTMRDISVYDLDVGLSPGRYRFELYINGLPQPIFGGLSWPTFTITEGEVSAQQISPTGSWIALVDDLQTLSVMDSKGNLQEMYRGMEIANLGWLPDDKHLIFVDRDRSEQNPVGMGIRDDIWIVNVETGQNTMLFEDNDELMRPFVVSAASASGYYVASVEGSGFFDACFVDMKVVIFEINPELESGSRFVQEDFAGLPSGQDMDVYPSGQGEWSSAGRFRIPLDFTCTMDATLKGSYVFDMGSLSVAKE